MHAIRKALVLGGVAVFMALVTGDYRADAAAASPDFIAHLDATPGILSAARYHRFSADHRVEIYRLQFRSVGLNETAYLVRPRRLRWNLPVLVFNPGGGGVNSRVLRYLSGIAADGPYLVLADQYRGTDGSQGVDGYGGQDVKDVLKLVEIAMHLPFARPEIGMLGFSRGGMTTYLAIKAGAPIKAAAVVSGPTDLIETYHDLGGFKGYFIKRRIARALGGNPGQVPQNYRDRSAFYWPQDIRVPVLILQGDSDEFVSADQVRRFAGELSALGRHFKLVMVRHGDHMLHRFPADRDWEILDWFHSYLN
ncbi:MAG: alpha/beta hydrolase family protein [Acidiferrobacterales bacterium]